MTQYLLSVWHDGDFELPDPVVMKETIAQVDAFNSELQTAGAWVFAGGLTPRRPPRSCAPAAAKCP
jgi:hypothetical protein